MIQILLYFFLIFLITYIASKHGLITRPFFWIWFPWVFLFLPIATGIIEYSNPPITFSTLLFVISHLFIITIGYLLSSSALRRTLPFRRGKNGKISFSISYQLGISITPFAHELRKYGRIIDILAVLGIIAGLLFSIDALYISGFAVENAAERRQLFIEGQASFLRKITPILAFGCFAALIALFWFGPQALGRRYNLYLISTLSLLPFSILSAGRQAIFQILILGFIAWTATRARKQINRTVSRNLYIKILMWFIVIASAWQMLKLSSDRSTTALESQIRILLSIFGAQLGESVYTFIINLDGVVGTGLTTAIIYFSSQLSSLSAILDPNAYSTWGISFGAYQFPWLYRQLEFTGITKLTQIIDIRRSFLGSGGYMAVSWSTGLATFVHDFGYIGSFFYAFLVGLFGGRIYQNFCRKKSYFSFSLLVASYAYLFYLVIFPLSSDTIYFFFVIAMWILDRRYAKNSSLSTQSRGFNLRFG